MSPGHLRAPSANGHGHSVPHTVPGPEEPALSNHVLKEEACEIRVRARLKRNGDGSRSSPGRVGPGGLELTVEVAPLGHGGRAPGRHPRAPGPKVRATFRSGHSEPTRLCVSGRPSARGWTGICLLHQNLSSFIPLLSSRYPPPFISALF